MQIYVKIWKYVKVKWWKQIRTQFYKINLGLKCILANHVWVKNELTTVQNSVRKVMAYGNREKKIYKERMSTVICSYIGICANIPVLSYDKIDLYFSNFTNKTEYCCTTQIMLDMTRSFSITNVISHSQFGLRLWLEATYYPRVEFIKWFNCLMILFVSSTFFHLTKLIATTRRRKRKGNQLMLSCHLVSTIGRIINVTSHRKFPTGNYE